MAQATVALVKELGGLNNSDDYNLWRFSTPDELDAALVRALAVASAWIRRRAPSLYTTTDADTLTCLGVGEAFLALHFIVAPLKARKVFGTHWALDQEDSSRFAELIDVEYKQLAEDALGLDLTIVTEPNAFARPTFTIGPVIDPLTDTSIESETEQLDEIVARARGVTSVIPVVNP